MANDTKKPFADPLGVERRFSADCELRVEGGDKPVLRGYAAVFNSLSEPVADFREVIAPGAFKRSLREKADVRALWDHDSRLLIGRTTNGTLTLAEDDRGLLATIRPPDTSVGRDVVKLVEERYLSQMSFAFRLWDYHKDQKWEEADEYTLRTVKQANLVDISIVAFPVYVKTSVDVAARSLEEWRAENAKSTATQRDELANRVALEGQRAALALTKARFSV